MALAKDVSAATYDFLLGQTGQLERKDVLLAVVAATASDGHAKQTREVLIYALERGAAASALREALLVVAPLAGAVRAEQALAALGEAVTEAEKPSDPFAALLDPKERKVAPSAVASPDDEQPAAKPVSLDSLLGERSERVRARLASRSKALARWVEEDLSRRILARSGLTALQRALTGIGAVFPLDARDHVADWLAAAKLAGADDASLWLLSETLARLFKEAPEIRNALSGFEIVLGRRIKLDD